MRFPGAGTLAIALVAVAALMLAACSGGSGNTAPTLGFQAPARNLDVQIGDTVAIAYVDDDPDDDAATDVYADRDGDLSTTGDRYTIATNRSENNGAVQNVTWDTTGVPAGAYHLVGVCSDGVHDPVESTCAAMVTLHVLWPMDHSNIVLKDRFGAQLQADSTEPYSPRRTCGTCHDVDQIANGYHFQQGRTDETGTIQTADDFFGDGRTFLKSDGMYGKW